MPFKPVHARVTMSKRGAPLLAIERDELVGPYRVTYVDWRDARKLADEIHDICDARDQEVRTQKEAAHGFVRVAM